MSEQQEGRGMTNSETDAVDDRGTNQTEGRAMLKKLRDQGFDSSDEKLAVALGRPVEEVEAWTGGSEPVDDDVIMKARGIATERGLTIE
jgi:hypothetical protein